SPYERPRTPRAALRPVEVPANLRLGSLGRGALVARVAGVRLARPAQERELAVRLQHVHPDVAEVGDALLARRVDDLLLRDTLEAQGRGQDLAVADDDHGHAVDDRAGPLEPERQVRERDDP